MKITLRASFVATLAAAAWIWPSGTAAAQPPDILSPDATRYLALGDSIAAGYQVVPVTNAYPFVLYRWGAFDVVPHTLFADAAIPGAASADFLRHQVPQAIIPAADGGFTPAYITITIGGNDLLSILHYMQTHPDPKTFCRLPARCWRSTARTSTPDCCSCARRCRPPGSTSAISTGFHESKRWCRSRRR